MANIIPLGSAAEESEDISLGDGESAIVFLSSGTSAAGGVAHIELLNEDASYTLLASMSWGGQRAYQVPGPVTFRVRRPVLAVGELGVEMG